MKSVLRNILRRRSEPNTRPDPLQAPNLRPWQSPDPALANRLVEHIDPMSMAAIQNGTIREIAQSVGPGLWLLPFFTMEGCDRLRAVIDHRLAWQKQQPQEPPNSMHYSGVVFEPMGLAPAMSRLRTELVDPIRSALFDEFGALDDDYAFAATYGERLDHRLGFHVDDSEVTLNVALCDGYEGGEIVFLGRRCAQHRQESHRAEEEIPVTIPKGHALLHAGSHRHLVTTVDGERRNLIVWCRSSASRTEADSASCPAWCGHQD